MQSYGEVGSANSNLLQNLSIDISSACNQGTLVGCYQSPRLDNRSKKISWYCKAQYQLIHVKNVPFGILRAFNFSPFHQPLTTSIARTPIKTGPSISINQHRRIYVFAHFFRHHYSLVLLGALCFVTRPA